MYNAIVTKITEKYSVPKADRLEFITVVHTPVITQKDLYNVGDLVIFFPSDGQLSYQYTDANDLVARYDENKVRINAGYLDEKRRVRAINLRGSKSDGLVMSISSLAFTGYDLSLLKEGEEFNTLNNIPICNKYINKATINKLKNTSARFDKLKTIAVFHEHVDTKQIKYYLGTIPLDSTIVITSKFHGTSGRLAHTKVTKETMPPIIFNLLNKLNLKTKYKKVNDLAFTLRSKLFNLFKQVESKYDYVHGTRRVVLQRDRVNGFYSSDDFRWKHADNLFPNLHKGEELYYEIVGYEDENKLIMTPHSTECTNDKEFIKKHGKSINYSYGCNPGDSDIYVYRIAVTNEDGHQWDLPWEQVKARCEELGVKHVPEIKTYYPNHFTNYEELLKVIQETSNYSNPDGSFSEGVCIRVEKGNSIKFFKEKNWHFKVMEGIIKDNPDIVDIEEAESY